MLRAILVALVLAGPLSASAMVEDETAGGAAAPAVEAIPAEGAAASEVEATSTDAAVAPEAEAKSTSAGPTEEGPSLASRWWNGHEAIYSNGFYLSLGLDLRSLQTGSFQTEGALVGGSAIHGGSTTGFRGEFGAIGRHFGFMILGGSYHVTGDGAELQVASSRFPVSVKALDVRLLQPRLRFALWRFELAAQAGPVAHVGWAKIDAVPGSVGGRLEQALESSFYGNVSAEVGGSLRFYPISFLYVEGAYSHSFKLFDLVGETTGMEGFHTSVGLSF